MASLMSADQPVVFSVGSDPEPDQGIFFLHSQSPVLSADSYRPELIHFFEVQRRVSRIFFEQIEGGVGQIAYRSRKLLVASPETGCGVMIHSDEVFPVLYSARASFTSDPSRPLRASASNCRSHDADSNASNQLRNWFKSLGGRCSTALSISFTVVMPVL
jgi:hypothetical protein